MRTYLPHLLLGAAAIGFVDAAYLYISKVSGDPLVCDILDGCNVVAASPYSDLFGVPLSLWGLLFYIAILLLSSFLYSPLAHRVVPYILGLSAIGFVMSAYFTYVQAFLIEAWCIYCLISAGVSVVLFALSVVLWRVDSVRALPLVDDTDHRAPGS